MIPRKQLPPCLWREGVLHLPNDIHDVYEAKLVELGLYEQASGYEGGHRGHGGVTPKETFDHFSYLYLNSISRVQCVMLDPHDSFAKIPRDLFVSLSSHSICILDIPCGAGAGSISALVTLKELRMANILPTTPLTVRILGADISKHALDIYRDQLEKLEQGLAEAGISVGLQTQEWDCTDVQQTNDLIDCYLKEQQSHSEYLVLLANFSGANKKLFEKFEESFRQIWIRLSSKAARNTTILWIEPNTNSATTLFRKIAKLLSPYSWFQRSPGGAQNFLACDYQWFSRIQGKSVPSGVMIHKYTRAK